MQVHVREFTDPGCPFAFSAEPAIWRLRWLYGDALDWETPDGRAVRLARGLRAASGFTVREVVRRAEDAPAAPRDADRLAPAAADGRHAPACPPFVAARLHAPDHEWRLLRALRVRAHGRRAARRADHDRRCGARRRHRPARPRRWLADPAVEAALSEDMPPARRPSSASLAQVHKLASTDDGGSRYTCPSFEFTGRTAAGSTPRLPARRGLRGRDRQPRARTQRRAAPESVEEVLAWADVPLATVEVAAVMGVDPDDAHADLARVAREMPVGAGRLLVAGRGAGRVAA